MAFLNEHKHTLFGVAAILLWGCIVALIRDVSELFSPIGGAAMMYSISAIFLVAVMGLPKINDFPKRYLIIGGGLFVLYEICLALSLGMANNRHQAMEMAVINYLWPALTILLTVILGKRKVSVLVYPSVFIAFLGVAWCITGDSGLSLDVLINNITENPITYLMAFSAAFIWAIYCLVTKNLSNGKNATPFLFIATAITLWIKYAFSDEVGFEFSLSSTFTLLLAGIVMGSAYALWNQAIIGGNLILLGTLSYFTPVFSTIFSSVYLSISLSVSFWQGVALVTIGSLICYFVTREKSQAKSSPIN
ncbi:aromatic amino acid DMT transporter YddG [Pseudoalteromonas ostreae]|uniref:aromatic amino acid DMT transporter YddG n=1 Tax=Pseudoalteromonas ostreae TaxID=2774154 RepID=UPI001B3716D4|nr:aromatic amino acid DMT transporter YddG [Pseudoalteromonas ostreae]